jgi:hypothetical protein
MTIIGSWLEAERKANAATCSTLLKRYRVAALLEREVKRRMKRKEPQDDR